MKKYAFKNLSGVLIGISLLGAMSVFQGCSKNSTGGYTVGAKRSPAWYMTAPAQDIAAHFDYKSDVELCNIWSAAFPGEKMWETHRAQVGNALTRRGKSPMYCSNPQQDEISAIRRDAENAKAEARRARQEAERAKRDAEYAKQRACDEAFAAYRACTASQSSTYGSLMSCRRPSCY